MVNAKNECFIRYELPLIRIASFETLAKASPPLQLVLISLANGLYFSDPQCGRLLCCVCEGDSDLRALLARVHLLYISSADTALSSSGGTALSLPALMAQVSALLRDAHGSLHRDGCPGAPAALTSSRTLSSSARMHSGFDSVRI